MKLTKLSLLILFVLGGINTPAAQDQKSNETTLFVTLENAPFNLLFLYDYTKEHTFLQGEKIAEYTWTFEVPDSIVQEGELLMFVAHPYDSLGEMSSNILFVNTGDEQLSLFSNIGLEEGINYIKAIYRDSLVYENGLMVGNFSPPKTGNLVCYNFELVLADGEKSDISVRSQDPFFAWFISGDPEKALTYDEFQHSYIALAKQFPDSRYLLWNLSLNLMNFRSKRDVQDIYRHLSPKYKQTEWAAKIDQFLSGQFRNSSLLNLQTGVREQVVQDSSKYNLVIFTASWCQPCIAEIPLLKQMHQDLHEKLIFTYITLDKVRDVEAFNKVLEAHQVPWRSLYALEDIKVVEQFYFVSTIPHVILVSPDGGVEILDVRIDSQRERVYSLVR